MGIEHRWHRRSRVNYPVQLLTRNGRLRGRLRNLSPGGLYVTFDRAWIADKIVRVRFLRPGDPAGAQCELSALIVHRAPGGIGLMVDHGRTGSAGLLRLLLACCDPSRNLKRLGTGRAA